MIHVKIIKPNARELRPFIRLAFDIYKGDPYWVPPFKNDLLKCLAGRDNDLFAQGIQGYFMAYDDEKPVARVMAGIDLRHNARLGQAEGYFSLFESYENPDYARAVLDAAFSFLKAHGINRVVGPIPPRYDFLNRGLLYDGDRTMPILENNYNHPFLTKVLEDYGFQKKKDYYAYLARLEDVPSGRIDPLLSKIQHRFGFRVETIDFSRGNLPRVAQEISTIICEAAPDAEDGFMPTAQELLQLFKRIKPCLRNDLAVMAYAGERPIGCLIAFFDNSPGRLFMRGHRMHWFVFKYAINAANNRTVRCPLQYVVPDYQNKAVNAVMLAKAVEGARKNEIRHIEGSLVDETHKVSINNTLMAGGRKYRVYRVFEKEI